MVDVIHPPRLEDLVRDAAAAESPCVSVYLSTARTGRATLQGAPQLRAALRDARREAEQAGVNGRLDSVLAPAERLLADDEFWQHQGDGLALLLAPGVEHVLRLPFAVEPFASCSDWLQLRPLLPLADDLEFLVLAFSQNHVRLLRGDRWGLAEQEAETLPRSLASVLWADDPEKSLQWHSHQVPHAFRAMFHGQGTAGSMEQHKEDLARYFRAIDQALLASPEGHADLPIVLASVDYCAAIFRSVSKNPRLVAQPIAGNPEPMSGAELHAAAWRLLAPALQQRHDVARELHGNLTGTGRTSDDLAEVLNAAQHGRVLDLFVDATTKRWGRPSTDGVSPPEVHAERRPGDVDLVDLAAVATLRNGGGVHPAAADMVLRDGLAANFRY